MRTAIVSLFLLGVSAVVARAQFYDLGGPCHDEPLIFARETQNAEQSHSWDKLIELEKRQVRAGCKIEFRWLLLASALMKADRQPQAIQLFHEMDARGFEINPSTIAATVPDLQPLFSTPAFKASPLGLKIEVSKKISNLRRTKFRAVLKSLPPNQRPPENYIAKGACPFECCHYSNWTVTKDTPLFAGPGSSRQVGTATTGSSVVGLTGEVHLHPVPVVVLFPGDIPKNTLAFVLDYEGEGFAHVLSRGKILSVSAQYSEYCLHPSESCWAESLFPSASRAEPVWWVKIKLPNGITGWTNLPDNFDGKDSCG